MNPLEKLILHPSPSSRVHKGSISLDTWISLSPRLPVEIDLTTLNPLHFHIAATSDFCPRQTCIEGTERFEAQTSSAIN